MEKGKINLFLDDVRSPKDITYIPNKIRLYLELNWEIVTNYDEFIGFLEKNGKPNIISFDHDLSDEHYCIEMYESEEAYDKMRDTFKEKTGLDCAKYLCEFLNGDSLPEYHCHSMNPIGKDSILNFLKNYEKNRSIS